MGRQKIPRKKMGTNEAASYGRMLSDIKTFKIFKSYASSGETEINKLLISHLKQKHSIENRNIHCGKLVGETFRPELFLPGRGSYPICAVECKKLTPQFAKGRFKEGLSQCLIYAEAYKSVVFVLYDFTRGHIFHKAFTVGNTAEKRFAKRMREDNRVTIVVLKPDDA